MELNIYTISVIGREQRVTVTASYFEIKNDMIMFYSKAKEKPLTDIFVCAYPTRHTIIESVKKHPIALKEILFKESTENLKNFLNK